MFHFMNEIRQIFQAFIVYIGSAFTILTTLFTESGLNAAREIVTIAVGLATFIYTIAKIAEIRQRMHYERRNHTKKH